MKREFLSKISKEALENVQLYLSIADKFLVYPGMYFRTVIEERFKGGEEKEAQLIYNTILLFEPKYLKGALFCDVIKHTLSSMPEEEFQETIKFINTRPLLGK